MADNPLLRIGPFSRASSLSVKTLRAYHDAGLLVPAEVDPRTGYRSYSAAQLTDAAVIRHLRQLDVPLEAIRAVLDARDPAVTKKVLAEHSAVLEERLAGIHRAIDQLYAALAAPAAHTPVHRRHEPSRSVLTLTGTVGEHDFEAFLDRARALLVGAAEASGSRITGPFGACYPTLLEDDAQDVVAFLPVGDPSLLTARTRTDGVRLSELAATDVAVLTHLGSYGTLDDSYRRLGAWVAANDEPGELPVRELYLVGPGESDDPQEYRTELCWPVQQRGQR